jgi:Cd2+/Zn2+-exporting ATPase
MREEKNMENENCGCASCAAKTEQCVESGAQNALLFRVRMAGAAALFVCGVVVRTFFDGGTPALLVFLAAWILAGADVLLSAGRNLVRGRMFDENFLMAIASAGAFAIGEYPEGVAVMLFYQIGEAFQNRAVKKSRRSISALMDIRPDFANLKTGGRITTVSPDAVRVGDLIVVKPGEKVPLDGRIVEGVSALDTRALTGESLPRDVGPGSEALSGSVNTSGVLVIEVTKSAGESTVSKILDLVQNAAAKKAPVENFITKFARYYTPAVVFAACALAIIPPLVAIAQSGGAAAIGELFAPWVKRALIFLVVSCPCALVISVPLSYFGGIGGASRNGILIKGSNYLEALRKIDTVVFDKTGTLTRGVFKVTQIMPLGRRNETELLYYAACAELFSNHPVARSIQKAYNERSAQKGGRGAIEAGRLSGQEEIAGLGVKVSVDGKTVFAGNAKLLEREHIAFTKPEDQAGTLVYLVIDGVLAGYLVISDEIKSDSNAAIAGLKELGVRKTVILSGDTNNAVWTIGAKVGIDTFSAELLPHEKVAELERLEKDAHPRGCLAFVGDGINDAPSLARSDIGIAMGGLGSDAAIEASDVVLMTDEPSRLITAVQIARKTHGIVMQNIVFALGVKVLILALGVAGLATIWEAVFADVGVAVIAILNAMRALQVETD